MGFGVLLVAGCLLPAPLGWLECFQQAPEAQLVLQRLPERKELGEQAPR